MSQHTAEKAEVVSFGRPHEIRAFPQGKLELVTIGGATVGRGVFEPGWRWSTSVQPMGHDAWVAGDEPAVVVDFQGMLDYARARSARAVHGAAVAGSLCP